MRAVAFALLAATAAWGAPGPVQVEPSVVLRAEAVRVAASVFTFSSRDTQLRVVAATRLQKPGPDRDTRLSVRDLSNLDAALLSPLLRKRHEPILISNGGFSSTQPDRPVGLLVSEGRTVSIPNFQRLPPEPRNGCEFRTVERFRFSALVCVDANGRVDIGAFSEARAAQCKEALQAAPVLGEQGRALICPSGAEAAVRTALLQRGIASSHAAGAL